MYEDYWRLNGSPFRNEADDQWFCETPGHDEALARLFFLVEQGRRCGLLAAPAGTGKSLLLRLLFAELERSQRKVVMVQSAGLDRHELLIELCDALKLQSTDGSTPFTRWRALSDQLAAWQMAHVQSVLLFDRFERAEPDCYRLIEQLLHLDVCGEGGLTVIVAARPESPVLSGLADLADLRIDVLPLDEKQTADYVAGLLQQAGCERQLFEPEALDVLFKRSQGVPRAINRLCDLSLLAAMSEGRDSVEKATVVRAAQELQVDATLVRNSRLRA